MDKDAIFVTVLIIMAVAVMIQVFLGLRAMLSRGGNQKPQKQGKQKGAFIIIFLLFAGVMFFLSYAFFSLAVEKQGVEAILGGFMTIFALGTGIWFLKLGFMAGKTSKNRVEKPVKPYKRKQDPPPK